MLASIMAAFWFAIWTWYGVTIMIQNHTNGVIPSKLVVVVCVLALAVATIPIIMLAV